MLLEVKVVKEMKNLKKQDNSSKLLQTSNLCNMLDPVMIEKRISEKDGKKFQEL